MMNNVAERIRNQIKLLTTERQKLEQQIKSLNEKDRQLKSHMHKTEVKILLDSGVQGSLLLHDANTLRHERQDLHQNEHSLGELTQKLHDLVKQINTYDFWMKYANSDDPAKQAEAQRKVFGS